MPQARRSLYVFFHCLDGPAPDLDQLLRGEVRLAHAQELYAVALLAGKASPITEDDLRFALSIPSSEWVDVAPDDSARVRELAGKGVLVTDEEDGELPRLRALDEALAGAEWNLYGAFHYLMTKWSGVDLRMSPDEGEFPAVTEQMVEQFVAERGEPPDPFHSLAEPLEVHELPVVRPQGGLYDALAKRKTTRGFDRSARMSLEELSLVLHQVWGCQGTAPIIGDIYCIKRTSPSGGGLHPIEAYPIVSGVEGIEAGIYHYDVRTHSLELMERLDDVEATELAADFTCGQNYFGTAHVSTVMTARFPRTHWKYPKQQKAYPVILMDAAHLSQTHYLVAAELGLGAYVTVAINTREIEERLGLDGITEGVVAMVGCGKQRPEGSPFEPRFTPYAPPRAPE